MENILNDKNLIYIYDYLIANNMFDLFIKAIVEENIKVRDTINTIVDGVDIYAKDIEKVLNELYTKVNDKK